MNKDISQVLESLLPEFVTIEDLKKTHYFENEKNKESFQKLEEVIKINFKPNNSKKNVKRIKQI